MDVTFESLGLSEAMLKALEKKGYGWPTTIQAEAIPHFMQWKDVIAKAPTGTGKTFAFGIPMIEHIDPACADIQGLILAPTRELAIQKGSDIHSETMVVTRVSHRRLVADTDAGREMKEQVRDLEGNRGAGVRSPGRVGRLRHHEGRSCLDPRTCRFHSRAHR